MSEDPDLAAVEEFGPYLVYERLGVGGMATVHRALERGIEGFERVVALKRLLPHLAEDASFIKSFVREAKLASTLQHPNIVQTLELGRVGGSYFISMEYIDGRDVRKILRHARKVSGPPPINVTLALMLQLCEALDYAHNRTDTDGNPLGIVHRDLSPSNLLLTRGGHLKIIDFGIAKAQAAHLATQTGRVKGKLAYMAPESIAGKELDARSDLFAAGVVFHELLTARPLFAQKNEYQTLLKVQRGEVAAPSSFNEGVPKELDDIVLKALAREPEDRWVNAAALRDALVTVRMARQLSATPRDVQTWCDWAFSLDIGGFSGRTGTEAFSSGLVSNGSFGTVSPIVRANTPTPLPRVPQRRPTTAPPVASPDEEAAAEIAWGAPEIDAGVPHLHDDVPDVSGKLLSAVLEAKTDEHAAFDPSSMGPSPGASGPGAPNIAAAAASAAASAAGGSSSSASQSGMSAAATQPDMQVSTIKTLAVPPPGPRSEVRPAAFPNGSSDDALMRARPRTITIPPKPDGSSGVPRRNPAGSNPPSPGSGPTLRGPAPPSRPPPLPGTTTARGSTVNLLGDLDSGDAPPPTPPHMTRPRRAQTAPGPTIGAAIAARETHGVRNTIIALSVLGAAALAITLAVTMGSDEVAPSQTSPTVEPLPKTTGTVKFVIDPADAVITIDGGEPHTGSPWQILLPAGLHQIQIDKVGHKSWLTSIELSGAETQTLRVVLEKVTGSAITATLVVDPSMPGLDVVLDDKILDQKTPLKMEIPPGPHTVGLSQNGVELWSEDFTAVANATHEFDPSMDAAKQQERKHRHDHTSVALESGKPAKPESQPFVFKTAPAPTAPSVATVPAPSTPTTTTTATPNPTAVGASTRPGPTPTTTTTTPAIKTTTSTTTPAPTPTTTTTTTTTPAAPTTPKTTPKTTPTPAPTPTPKSTAPVTIPPTKVSRTSGSIPSLKGSTSLAGERIPANISAKVCIDTGGGVTSASVLTKLPAEAKTMLEKSIRTWRYSAYKDGGTAVPACFVASFRSQ